MTKYPELFSALAGPFDSQELKVRNQSGRQLQYVTARTIMNRLDDVLGPENWYDSYESRENSVLCKLTIRLPDGELLTKQDAGGCAGLADSGDDDKSAFSDALKRAAVKLGIGRYLYGDGVPKFSQASSPASNGHHSANGNGKATAPPRTGKELYARVKTESANGFNLLKYLGDWGRSQGYPSRIVDWTDAQASAGYAEAVRVLHSR